MKSGIAGGYLVLVDISGFTSFVAGSELDHSRAILGEIFNLIIRRFTPLLTLAEIEGDAVFAFASDHQLPRGETLLEIIEATYVDFRDHQRSGQRTATCKCTACQMSGQLDLKFITHYGDFVLQNVAGKQKPLGSSVNLLHRLTKSKVGEATGWRGYALFTEESLSRMDVHPLNVHAQLESYEHLGDVKTFTMNLADRYKELTEERYAVLPPEKAHVVLSRDFPVSPSVLWEWLNDPKKRLKWMVDTNWRAKERPQGRTSRGAVNHCSNSGFIEYILDWRPFSYYTVKLVKRPVNMTITSILEPITTGTRLTWRARLNGPLPGWILRALCKLVVSKGARTSDDFAALSEILERRSLSAEVEV
jgi:hypothetical protein